MRHVIIY